jgi:AcrR family transcriptional regulator
MARPRSDIRPRIVHAARARFLAEGVDGASLRDIAKDAKTTIGMVSYYFASKDELFLAVVEEIYATIMEGLAAALHHDAPVRERLRRVSAYIGNLEDAQLDVMRLVAREALLSNERFARLFARFQVGHVALLMATLGEAVGAGEIDAKTPLPVLLPAVLASLALPQIIRRAVGSRAPFQSLPNADDLAAMLVDTLFHGIAPRRRA